MNFRVRLIAIVMLVFWLVGCGYSRRVPGTEHARLNDPTVARFIAESERRTTAQNVVEARSLMEALTRELSERNFPRVTILAHEVQVITSVLNQMPALANMMDNPFATEIRSRTREENIAVIEELVQRMNAGELDSDAAPHIAHEIRTIAESVGEID